MDTNTNNFLLLNVYKLSTKIQTITLEKQLNYNKFSKSAGSRARFQQHIKSTSQIKWRRPAIVLLRWPVGLGNLAMPRSEPRWCSDAIYQNKMPTPFPSIQSLEIGIGLNCVTKQLKVLNPNKASGPDEIPAKVLKETANEISAIIHHIFQKSYTSGQLPEAWKINLVTAIYKKRLTRQTIDQYR